MFVSNAPQNYTAGTTTFYGNITSTVNYTTAMLTAESRIEDDEERTIIRVKGKNPILRTDYGDIDLAHLVSMTQQMADILCSVKERVQLSDEYPALEEAYLHYQIVEKLVREPRTD